MDLSGLIFVALFVGWAIYLIPKFMRDHEELATTRSLQDFSARLRVFAATRNVAKQNLLGVDDPTVEISMDEIADALASPDGRVRSRSERVSRPIKLPTRAAAKKAAKRRRRVLLVLLTLTAIVNGLAVAHIGPIWTPAIPAAFVLLFMITARRSVRRMNRARKAAAAPFVDRVSAQSEDVSRSEAPAPIITHETDVEVALIASIEADNAADTHAAAAADRLWDPVPVTLPTYLDKPAARRTVMSIELNRGMVSSGHDAADSELVRATEAAAADETPTDLEAPRRVAGA
ncbi:MAG: divisome protein SepX/GlpR [Marmoricola sp.]